MADIRVTELDFNAIKQNLKTYLKSQSEFSDYDFDGAGLNVLLDVLAYNTHYNAVLAHLQANEMFLDTAIKRASVVSIAKTLGYVPRSSTSARARVNITVSKASPAPATLTLLPSVKFTASLNGNTYTFNVSDEKTVSYNSETQSYVFEDVDLLEGVRLTNSYVIASDTVSGPLQIPVPNIDTSTLEVSVYPSTTLLTPVTPFTRSTDIIDINADSAVYWLEETPEGTYNIIFGDDILGKKLSVGNVVVANYIACNGTNANGASTFTLIGSIDGETNVTVELVNKSASGSFKETIDEIRYNAPKFNATRNRVVTAQDYKTLILSQFNRAKSVVVWGGEENTPPIYGKVFITIDPKDGEVITEADKDYISESILRPRAVMSIQHEFVDPDYIYVGFDMDVKYNPRLTTLTTQQLRAEVIDGIEEYFNTNLKTLDKTFIYSQFTDYISQLDSSIVGILVKMRLQRRLDVETNSSVSQMVKFLTPLVPGTIKSTQFRATINEINYTCYVQDFSDTSIIDENGTGTLKLVEASTKNVLRGNIGTVNYATGDVYLSDLTITAYLGSFDGLRINAKPQELGKNISPSVIPITQTSDNAVVPSPSKNSIIELDDSPAESILALSPGLVVTVTPYIANS